MAIGSVLSTQTPPFRRLVAKVRVWPRTPLLAGPGGVGIALGAVEGVATGLSQLWLTRSRSSMRDQFKHLGIAASEATELAQINIGFLGVFRIMQGVVPFLVGKAAVGLADTAIGAIKRSICGCFVVLMTTQTLLHAIILKKTDQEKKFKKIIGIQGLVYAGIAVLNVLGVAKKGEPEALKD